MSATFGALRNTTRGALKVQFFLTRPTYRLGYDAIWRRFGGFHSLAIPVLLALTPDSVESEVVDQSDTAAVTRPADIAAVSFMTSHAPAAFALCDELRRTGKTVVLGGIHASALPDEALQHADVVAIGAGEHTWPLILRDFALGRLKSKYIDTTVGSLAEQPRARHDLMPHHGLRRLVLPIQTTRGCPYDCDFCSITAVFGRSYHMRPIDTVIAEIADTSADFIALVDDNIAVNRRYAADLFTRLIPLRKRWVSQSDISIANDDELLALAAKAGCVALLFGLESISQLELDAVGKGNRKSEEYLHLLRKVHRHGIMTIASFIVGLDGQTPDVFERTVSFARKAGVAYAYMPILTPYPGTRLRDRLSREGRLLHTDWSKYDGSNVVFEPRGMTKEELRAGWVWAKSEIASARSILDRLRTAPVRLRYSIPFNAGYWLQTLPDRLARR